MPLDNRWSRAELALGVPLGVVPEALDLPATAASPRQELERIIDQQHESGRQVFVCFSGGRDSSAVLALAVHVARRRGAPAPIPVTLRFPGHPESDENRWQDMVVDHLGLRDWIVIERPDVDLLEPAITDLLTTHGLLYPSQIGSYVPIVSAAAGGVLLTGEGGDESFGGWQLRAALHPIAWGPRSAARSVAVAAPRPGARPRQALVSPSQPAVPVVDRSRSGSRRRGDQRPRRGGAPTVVRLPGVGLRSAGVAHRSTHARRRRAAVGLSHRTPLGRADVAQLTVRPVAAPRTG